MTPRLPPQPAVSHVWWWRKHRGDRKNQPCLVLERGGGSGPRNVLVEFTDFERVVAPRHAVRRLTDLPEGCARDLAGEYAVRVLRSFELQPDETVAWALHEDVCRECSRDRQPYRSAQWIWWVPELRRHGLEHVYRALGARVPRYLDDAA